jgi:hypothetical protein
MVITLIEGTFLTTLVVLVSIAGLLGARYFLKGDLKSQHDITDPYSQFVAMLFAVLLGFMVADSMQRFGDARRTVQAEASALANIFRLSEGYPADECSKLRHLCLEYAEEVTNVEWPLLTKHQVDLNAWSIYRKLWKETTTYKVDTQSEANVQQALLTAMTAVGDNRRMRVEALHSGLPLDLWLVLIIGGIATIVFTYFFRADDVKIQIVMVGMVSLVICLNLFLLSSYDDPFSGDVMVTPAAFETQVKLFKLELEEK